MTAGHHGEMRLQMDKWEEGRTGESIIRDIFVKKKYHFMQADLLVKINNKWMIAEIKYQEQYNAPPFDGHGLPRWQVDARLGFQNDTGIRAILFVVDKITNVIYWHYLDTLMEGEYHQTHGSKPRIIFPLTSYLILNIGS